MQNLHGREFVGIKAFGIHIISLFLISQMKGIVLATLYCFSFNS